MAGIRPSLSYPKTMENETTNESNAKGKKPDNDSKEDKGSVTPIEAVQENYEKLKAANDKVEGELLRGEELKAKIAMGGKSIAGEETKEETQADKDQAQADLLLADDE